MVSKRKKKIWNGVAWLEVYHPTSDDLVLLEEGITLRDKLDEINQRFEELSFERYNLDYKNMETVNRLSHDGDSWTVEAPGGVKCKCTYQVGQFTPIPVMQVTINGEEFHAVGMTMGTGGGKYLYGVITLPVSEGDVVSVSGYGMGGAGGDSVSVECYFIPLRKVNNSGIKVETLWGELKGNIASQTDLVSFIQQRLGWVQPLGYLNQNYVIDPNLFPHVGDKLLGIQERQTALLTTIQNPVFYENRQYLINSTPNLGSSLNRGMFWLGFGSVTTATVADGPGNLWVEITRVS